MTKVSWIILCTLNYIFVYKQADANLVSNGSNVCSRQQSFAQSYVVSIQQSVNKQVTYKCRNQGQFWKLLYKTCYRTLVVYQVGYKQLYRVAYRTIYVCCNGWLPTGNNCTTPICFQGCNKGTCIKPNVCTCLPGFHGASCNQTCQSNKWGPGCSNTCQCRNNATCDMRNGYCSCLSGWRGQKCDQPCQQGYYGNKCGQICTCLNGAICDHVTGVCSCSPGWQGQQCDVSCSLGHYGDKCHQICKCQNNTKCDHVTGVCSCTRGYQGAFCDKPCDSGFYGNRCQEKCRCEHGSCDHVSGTCTCIAGYKGARCAEICPTNTYGINCSLPCYCPQNAICDPKDGACNCKKGFVGESCDHKCQSGHYGNQCQEKCTCNNDESCDPVDGKCTCKHEKCNERLNASKGKSSGAQNGPLIPAVVSVIVILIIISIAITCFVYHKRRNQRMRNKPTNEEPVYEFSDVNAASRSKKEKEETYQLVMNDSRPTYMKLNRTSGGPSQDDVNKKGIQNLTYQKLDHKTRESRLSDLSSVSMKTEFENLGSAKETESVYQLLQKDSVLMKTGGDERKNDSRSAYQSLNRPNSDSCHVKPGCEPKSTSLYDHSTFVSRDTLKKDDKNDNHNDNLYLELISDTNLPGTTAALDDQPYEILPPTANDNRPIYDNL